MIRRFWKNVSSRLLRIDHVEVSFARRGFFISSEGSRQHLENIGVAFLDGYNLAIRDDDQNELVQALINTNPELQGFFFEGAAMALSLMDHIFPLLRGRWNRFLHQVGNSQRYILHVGIGWALARVPWCRRNPERYIKSLDLVLRWFALDGFGFHEGYFSWRKTLVVSPVRNSLSSYGKRVYDQGLGRSLWFIAGGDIDKLVWLCGQFEPSRLADIWSGIGLACAYAGCPTETDLSQLRKASKPYILHVGQGVLFAAEAHNRGGISVRHTDHACRVLCGVDTRTAVIITNDAWTNLPIDRSDMPLYELWRSRVRDRLRSTLEQC